METRLTDFEETKAVVIEHHRALNRRLPQQAAAEEKDMMLDAFF